MASFTPFSRLPTELRHMIWELAIEEESKHRLVLLDVLIKRITPTSSLVSPFLTTCHQSRHVALKHFNTTVEVFRMPRSERIRLSSFDDGTTPRRETGLTRFCLWALNPLRFREPKGILYLNLSRDIIFPFMLPTGSLMATQEWRDLTNDREGPWNASLEHTTKPLSGVDPLSLIKTVHLFSINGTRPRSPKYRTSRDSFYPEHNLTTVDSVYFLFLEGMSSLERLFYDLTSLSGREFLQKWSAYYMEFELCKTEEVPAFPYLSIELQQATWLFTIEPEYSERMVPAGDITSLIHPTLRLVFPLLSVNQQSRSIALQTYSVTGHLSVTSPYAINRHHHQHKDTLHLCPKHETFIGFCETGLIDCVYSHHLRGTTKGAATLMKSRRLNKWLHREAVDLRAAGATPNSSYWV
ncbi:hypothetical protein F5X99DRAFT_409160 [Biscogniauxia marginata]|nr:hypothetical protein F5X99DRAFT_409160 [Biscogniauxia marginata]